MAALLRADRRPSSAFGVHVLRRTGHGWAGRDAGAALSRDSREQGQS
ncbi:hypothetical protein ACFWFI_06265 [Streptomyces sp. NPDC060209]